MRSLAAFASGLLFGLGLLVSGMADPAKVLSFLDVGGRWDPSLALVMVAAVAVAFPAFRFARGRPRALLDVPMALPPAGRIDGRLLAGSAIFGIGWGLAGFCPGPAIVAFVVDHRAAAPFLVGMVTGMAAFEALERRRARAG